MWKNILTGGYISAVEFEPCSHPVKNKPCNMTCHVPDFSQIISINFNGMTRGSCNIFGCDSNMIKDSGRNAVHLRIPSLSYTNESGQWTCTYQANISSPSDVAVFSKYLNYFQSFYKNLSSVSVLLFDLYLLFWKWFILSL